MTKFVLLLVFVVLIQAGWALKCKRCKDETCKELEDETCGTRTDREAACLKLVYKVGDQEFMEKKCVEKMKDKKYECVATKSETITECATCMSDFCNTAPKINIGLLSIVAAVVALVAPRFL